MKQAALTRTRLEQMFDPEVLAQLRETFDRADAGQRLHSLLFHVL